MYHIFNKLVHVSTRVAVGYFTLGLTRSPRALLSPYPAVGLATGRLSKNGKNMPMTKMRIKDGLKPVVSTQ